MRSRSKGRAAWFKQLDGIYCRGWEAGKAGRPDSDCPYRGTSGVQMQRAVAWMRGHKRGASGKPESDTNG